MPSRHATAARPRPSADATVPHDVTDVMLWRLAFDVAVEHQRGPKGCCTNLRCAGQRGPCDAAVQAEQAEQASQAARRRATTAPRAAVPQAKPPAGSPPVMGATHHRDRAIGRAAVTPPNAGRFTGWLTQTASDGQPVATHLPRRNPGTALAAA
ncbi:hypothetical protein [Virgisporangium aurantiacum]|uniref:Uncharacterized protein n=1 Tax=Virgisporangium aurantiacum TaxID=175570 RepID=A0A8J3ZJ50_9ACTN|nr:hypothetical protein [Virgisporangium aurantiacum]GIJ64844.1 hypothetical protein Vau01_123600 [Virgisporangium aurantiacum]